MGVCGLWSVAEPSQNNSRSERGEFRGRSIRFKSCDSLNLALLSFFCTMTAGREEINPTSCKTIFLRAGHDGRRSFGEARYLKGEGEDI